MSNSPWGLPPAALDWMVGFYAILRSGVKTPFLDAL